MLRKKHEYTLEQFANIIGSKKAYVWQLENKSPAKPSGELLVKIAKALNVTESYLIDDEQTTVSERQSADVLLRTMQQRKISVEDLEKVLDVFDAMRSRSD